MKSIFVSLAILGQLGHVQAYPGLTMPVLEERQQKGGFHEAKPEFHPADQLVSVEGEHRFIPPDFAAGDVRGPCPGLNAMANHGYLPRNGVGGPLDFIKGTFAVFGMGTDLATVLTTIGGSLDGNGLQWSIGGISKHLQSPLPGVLGTPQGISGSHNKYESDVSPGRGDLYIYGNDYDLQMSQFRELYKMGQENGDHYSLELLREFRSRRFEHSIQNNPYFFNGPFTGILVQPAAYEFIYRFMSNKSHEWPRGHLNSEVLMSFFGVKKDKNGELYKVPGHERIPYNWYKRALSQPYTQTALNEDTATAALANHKFLSVGGNLGKVNTFTGVDPANITYGVYNSKNLMEGNNLGCFALGFQAQAVPDLIKCSSVLQDVESHIAKVQSQIGEVMDKLSCPKLTKIDTTQFKQFPGYSKLDCKTGKYTT